MSLVICKTSSFPELAGLVGGYRTRQVNNVGGENMKMKLKALVAALILGAAVQANAAISVDGLPHLGTGSGNGELFLSVIDRGGSSPESYVLDLGSLGTTGSILTNPSSLDGTSIAADNYLNDLLDHAQADGGSVYWQIDGLINTVTPSVNIGALVTSQAVLSTSDVPYGALGLNTPFNYAANYVAAVNQAAGTTDTSENLSVVIPSSNASAYYDGSNWGAYWLNPVNSEAGIGQSMGFYYVQATGNDTSQVTPFPGLWNLSTEGLLTYTAPSTVPLPPAVWQLGSALVSLAGVGRRRNAAAA